MYFRLIVAIQCLTVFVGTFCRKITLGTPQRKSPCTSGLRTDWDTFVISGTVARKVSNHLTSNWQDVLTIEVLEKTGGFRTICSVSLIATSCSIPDSSLRCYCDDMDVATGQAHFVIHYPAREELSLAIIRASWKHYSSIDEYSNNQTLPEMHSVNAAELTLTVYGATENLNTSGPCNVSLALNKTNDLTVCCTSTVTPCYPRISMRGDIVTNESCVSFSASRLKSEGFARNLFLSYSLCTKTDYMSGGRCTVVATPAKYTLGYSNAESHVDDTVLILTSVTGVAFFIFAFLILYIYLFFGERLIKQCRAYRCEKECEVDATDTHPETGDAAE